MRYDKEKTNRNIDGVKTSNTRTKECALAIARAIKDGSELALATKNYIETLFDGLRLRGGISESPARNKWEKGVKQYALELAPEAEEKEYLSEEEFRKALLNGAQALKEASNLICRLIFFNI